MLRWVTSFTDSLRSRGDDRYGTVGLLHVLRANGIGGIGSLVLLNHHSIASCPYVVPGGRGVFQVPI